MISPGSPQSSCLPFLFCFLCHWLHFQKCSDSTVMMSVRMDGCLQLQSYSPPALVHLRRYNEVSQTWVAYKWQKCISHSAGGWKCKAGLPAWWGEGPLPGCRPLYVLTWWRGRAGSLRPLLEGPHPIPEGSTLTSLSTSHSSSSH